MNSIVVELVVLLLPAGVANSVPVVAARYNWLQALAYPIDGGSGILGDNKTWRGLVVGILFGLITSNILYLVIQSYPYASVLVASMFGAATSFGALAGDSIKSFIKRRLRIAPGKAWRPFDQIDSTIGALIAIAFFVPLSVMHIVIALVLFGSLSFVTSYIGHALKIKKEI